MVGTTVVGAAVGADGVVEGGVPARGTREEVGGAVGVVVVAVAAVPGEAGAEPLVAHEVATAARRRSAPRSLICFRITASPRSVPLILAQRHP